jgi:hypothetical protein
MIRVWRWENVRNAQAAPAFSAAFIAASYIFVAMGGCPQRPFGCLCSLTILSAIGYLLAVTSFSYIYYIVLSAKLK